MSPKEFLEQAFALESEARLLQQKANALDKYLSEIEELLPDPNEAERIKNQITKYRADAGDCLAEMVKKWSMIEQVISEIEDKDIRRVLARRYLCFQPWESKFDKSTGTIVEGIAASMSYSVRHVMRFHKEGLELVGKILQENKTCQ